jgi:hypothetical protein
MKLEENDIVVTFDSVHLAQIYRAPDAPIF